MKRVDLVTAGIVLILAAAITVTTRGLPFVTVYTAGSRFMPLVVAGASILLALLLFLEIWRRKEDESVSWPDRAGAVRAGVTFAAILAFATLIGVVGMIAAGVLFVLVILVAVLRQPLLPSLFATAVTTVLIYAIFVAWLGVPLPRGVVGI